MGWKDETEREGMHSCMHAGVLSKNRRKRDPVTQLTVELEFCMPLHIRSIG